MRILFVEDDISSAKRIVLMLRAEGYVCDTTDLGEDALELARLYDYDIILLDLLLPDIEGYEVLRRWRATSISTPVLIVSGLEDPHAKIKGLALGADDYLAKPFDDRELIARIQAIVRRSRGYSASFVRTGKLAVNLKTRTVEVEGRPLFLTGKEYGVLELLCLRKGMPLGKEQIMDHLYGGRDEPRSKIIDVFVSRLRKKLMAACGGESLIDTVWGRGYVMRDPVEACPDGEQHPRPTPPRSRDLLSAVPPSARRASAARAG
jgi:two-component system cell cycle response regulator CtrA